MKTYLSRLVFVLSAVTLLMTVGCGESTKARQQRTRAEREEQARQEKAALKIGVLPTLDCLPLFIAQDDSLFASKGVDVRLRLNGAQIDNDTCFVGQHIEGMVTDKIRAERIARQGMPVMTLAETNAYWLLFANPKSRIHELSQLGDKMVAMTRYSVTDHLTDVALKGVKTHGSVFRVQFNDVRLRLKMLENNEMDALWLPEPQATKARLMESPVLYDARKSKVNYGVIVFNQKVMQDAKRQRQLKQFVAAYNAAVDSISKHGVGAYGALIKKYCGSDDKTVKALPNLKFSHITVK